MQQHDLYKLVKYIFGSFEELIQLAQINFQLFDRDELEKKNIRFQIIISNYMLVQWHTNAKRDTARTIAFLSFSLSLSLLYLCLGRV